MAFGAFILLQTASTSGTPAASWPRCEGQYCGSVHDEELLPHPGVLLDDELVSVATAGDGGDAAELDVLAVAAGVDTTLHTLLADLGRSMQSDESNTN